MNRKLVLVTLLLLAAGVVAADDRPETEQDAGAAESNEARTPQNEDAESAGGNTEVQTPSNKGPKETLGMSILGNQEAPKSLVIVPWKSSQIGDSLGISTMLDDSRQPVDREVFMRELSYYEIRSETTP
jgi:hypothetical protein